VARAPKGTPTSLNVWAMARHFAGAARAPRLMPPTDIPHLRRCLVAGLCVVEGEEIVLTDAGREAIARSGR
jgi:hypothetical protein